MAAILNIAALSATGCADGLLLYPSQTPLQSPAARRTVSFEGGDLELWTMCSQRTLVKSPEIFILSFIGNADRAELWAISESECWRDSLVDIWTVNYPGYGGSSGPAALGRIPSSALAAFDEIRKVAGNRPILVSGNSIGTTAALYVAANRPVAGVVLRNPPPLRSLILGRYGWWNLWIAAGIVACQVPSELDSLANAREVKVPAVFILSKDDEVIPASYKQDVVDAYAGEKRLVPLDGGHNATVGTESKVVLREALRWLDDAAKVRRSRSAEK